MRRLGTMVLFAALLIPASPALATHTRVVTIAARECPTFKDITANRARNNIQETLEDLGADSPYLAPGVPNIIDPYIEATNQPNCVPLEGWDFTLGTGIQAGVTGPWGALSIVTGAYPGQTRTQKQVPLRDENGHPIGNEKIAGAVTITLTGQQIDQIAERLWIQGGTPSAPIPDATQWAFGALRCGVDNLNGDNVEWIDYPTGAQHVFCFAYYVKPPPKSGTIKIVKRMEGFPASTPSQTFEFSGNISYTADQKFTIEASPSTPGSETFYRAGGQTWSFAETVPPGIELASLTCASATGASTSQVSSPGASVALAAGDTVTCTFVNRPKPPPSGMLIRKVTTGGIGSFVYSVTGDGGNTSVKATTTTEGVAAAAGPVENTQNLPFGRYRIQETLARTGLGDWTLTSVRCGTVSQPILGGNAAVVNVTSTSNNVCTFYNRFTPAGSIRIHKVTLGATASVRFQIRPQEPDRAETLFEQVATTTSEGVPVLATGDDTSAIPLGTYAIQESTASYDGTYGNWRVESVVCNGIPQPTLEGIILIRLTPANPAADCTFTNRLLRPDPEPPEPPEPEPVPPNVPPAPAVVPPDQGGVLGTAAEARPDLVVTKSVRPRIVRVGQLVRYVITVRNRGRATARDVTVAERNPIRHARLDISASQGHCRNTIPVTCPLGDIRAGQTVTLRVALRPRRTGRYRNVVAVNSASRQLTRLRKDATAVVRIVARRAPRVTG